ncbi:hypothetical protein A0H76_1002 [Hepatospora eriocheir]|uniref:Uncharacterized protein n=1 Tax=Hepatospora eriocheir TaxID=1081669 RepID=A0A1X0Q6C8_9MICR|nr:hypothetical protein A0H76_1002 [Hepatospora eriocheir]
MLVATFFDSSSELKSSNVLSDSFNTSNSLISNLSSIFEFTLSNSSLETSSTLILSEFLSKSLKDDVLGFSCKLDCFFVK